MGWTASYCFKGFGAGSEIGLVLELALPSSLDGSQQKADETEEDCDAVFF